MAERISLHLPEFRSRLGTLRTRVAELAGDRPPPRIVVVTKYLAPADCERLRGEAIGPLGENRAQDLERKVGAGEDREGWHFIGHLQRNKIGIVVPRVGCLHSLDSERLARSIDRYVDEMGLDPLPCLVQVNIAGERTKGGLPPAEAKERIPRWCDEFRGLRIEGLMTMAPAWPAEECRPVFRALRALSETVRSTLSTPFAARFQELSMGMSSDYEVAVEEGATLLRIGRMLYSTDRV